MGEYPGDPFPGSITLKPVSIADYRRLAKKRLPHFLFEFLDGGSYAESTKTRNTVDLQSVSLRQRVLRDMSNVDLSTSFLGRRYEMPVGLAPIGLAGLFARRGEVQGALAAQAAGVPFTLSTVGVCPIGEVAGVASQPFWFQLYMIRDRMFLRDLLFEAKSAGCSVLVLTVDMPVPGPRYRDYRSGLAGQSWLVGNLRRALQAMLRPRWALEVGVFGRPHHLGNVAPVLAGNTGLEDFMAWMGANFDPSVSWNDLEFVREHWQGPIVLKGITDAEDARRAAELGVDGIVVSNHGGRQLDATTSPVLALPSIVKAVGGRVAILADGGVRSGLDVLRLLALGAEFVLIGRSWVYALAAQGQEGVESALELIRKELLVAMTLSGCSCLADIGTHVLDQRS